LLRVVGPGDSDGNDSKSGDLFSAAMGGVVPLAGRETVRRGRPPKRRKNRPAVDLEPAEFVIRGSGESMAGLAPGIASRELRRLRRGDYAVELEVDLHGMTKPEGRRSVQRTLGRAIAAGNRCVAVIHGRGSRSAGRAVLKEELPAWLAEPPHGSRILAFTTANPERGGAGVTLVLLRRKRSPA
jgi:DNA-nicking Smr family endonuclease